MKILTDLKKDEGPLICAGEVDYYMNINADEGKKK